MAVALAKPINKDVTIVNTKFLYVSRTTIFDKSLHVFWTLVWGWFGWYFKQIQPPDREGMGNFLQETGQVTWDMTYYEVGDTTTKKRS